MPGNGRFDLNAQQTLDVGPGCASVWSGDAAAMVTIEEEVPEGWELYAVFADGVGFYDPLPNPITVDAGPGLSPVVVFKNRPGDIDMAPGRMTGGGGQIQIGDVYVSRGFTIHCDITLSNNVNVNWDSGNYHWHIDKPLTSATCIDDPAIDPAPPPAPFDTFIGEAVGSLNGVDGSFIRFVFIDGGEPSARTDRAGIQIWAPGDDPDVDAPMLNLPLSFLDHGNIQAHYDQPHK